MYSKYIPSTKTTNEHVEKTFSVHILVNHYCGHCDFFLGNVLDMFHWNFKLKGSKSNE